MNFHQKQNLTVEQLLLIDSEVNEKRKYKIVAWLLWFFLGGLGAHRFYVGDVILGIGMILVWIISLFTFFIPISIWLIVDAFLINKNVNNYNQKIEKEAIGKVVVATSQTEK